MRNLILALALVWTSACAFGAPPLSKGAEDDVPADGKLDSLRKPTDHGVLRFDEPLSTALDASTGFHAWTFSLNARADVEVSTARSVGEEDDVDTVLYLYERTPAGTWGRALAKNDDHASTPFSRIARTLEPGEYRVVVKGYSRQTRGWFSITVRCAGDGCATPQRREVCAFGDSYGDLLDNARFSSSLARYRTATELRASDASGRLAPLAIAAAALCYAGTRTLDDAFDNVDDGGLNIVTLSGALGTYVAVEYGAGDNSYGGVFDSSDGRLVAKIHDGDIYIDDCAVRVPGGA